VNLVSSIVQPLRDFFFTTACFHCGNQLSDGESRICAQCWSSLTPVHRNDYTYTMNMERFLNAGFIDDFFPLYYFEKGKVLQSLAHALKYEDITSFGRELGEKIGTALNNAQVSADAIIPVPLNRRKERERGYNQSVFIAEGVSRMTSLPVFPRAVHRIKYTITQTQLSAGEREKNIADAFSVEERWKEKIQGNVFIVVDDIVTTGSTMQELGKILKNAGARKIIAASAGLAKLGEEG
jgi:ComF family protein